MNRFPTPEAEDRDDDREGLDLLASLIDRVADDLPAQESAPTAPTPLASPARGPWPRVESAPRPEPALRPRGRRSHFFRLAAAAAIALLAYPAYLGLVQLPTTRAELATLRAQQNKATAEGNEAVRVAWISPPRQATRENGEPSATQLFLPARGNVVFLLELPPGLAAEIQSGARLELLDAQKAPALAWELSATEVRRQLQSEDSLPILLRQGQIAPGPYTLRLSRPDGTELTRADLELQAETQ